MLFMFFQVFILSIPAALILETFSKIKDRSRILKLMQSIVKRKIWPSEVISSFYMKIVCVGLHTSVKTFVFL